MMLSAKIAAIEIDDDRVRLAVVKTGGGLPTLLEVHSRPLDYAEPAERPAATALALQAILSEVQSRPSAFVLCVSSRCSVIRALSVPLKGARRVAAAVRFELEPYLAFPIEELIVDFAHIRETGEGTEVLAVGMRRSALEAQLAILAECGIDPDGIGLDAAGLTALWQAGRKAKAELHAALHVRDKGAILAVTRGKALVYFRHLPVSVALAHENPAGAARDVQNSLRSFRSAWETGEEPMDLTVTGVDLFEEERRLFEESFEIPVVYEDLRGKLRVGRGVEAETEAREGNPWETLAGVAQAAAANSPYAFNFRKDELARPHEMRGLLRHALFSGAIALLALAGYGAYLHLDYRQNREETVRLGDEVWKVFSETFPNSQRARDGRPSGDVDGSVTLGFMQEVYEETMGGRREVPLDMFRGATFLDILAEIGRHMPDDKVTITQVRLEAPTRDAVAGPRQRLVIAGVANSPEAVNQVAAQLGRAGLLELAGDPQMNTTAEGNWKFSVTVYVKGAQQGVQA